MIITEDLHFGINAQSANYSDGRKYNLKISAIFDHGREEFAAFRGALASIKKQQNKKLLDFSRSFRGGIGRSRTYDLHDVNVAL